MLTSAAIDTFGSRKAIAEALDISLSAVYQWPEMVPPLSAARLAKLSRGKLKFDPDAYGSWNNRQGAH